MEDGVCFIVLCESSYPRKLAFHYLQDLQTEFDKFDKRILAKITRPYSFVKFGKSLEVLHVHGKTNQLTNFFLFSVNSSTLREEVEKND